LGLGITIAPLHVRLAVNLRKKKQTNKRRFLCCLLLISNPWYHFSISAANLRKKKKTQKKTQIALLSSTHFQPVESFFHFSRLPLS
jgi:hypothetical protein